MKKEESRVFHYKGFNKFNSENLLAVIELSICSHVFFEQHCEVSKYRFTKEKLIRLWNAYSRFRVSFSSLVCRTFGDYIVMAP